MSESSRNERDGLVAITDKLESGIHAFCAKNPEAFGPCVAVVLLLIASPLILFWIGVEGVDKWSEIVKNAVESIGVLAAAFGIFKWVTERRDRATEVLLKLEEKFNDGKVLVARDLVDDDGSYMAAAEHLKAAVKNGRAYREFDALLRFYVVLYGVRSARQVPDEALSICFRYWLAHYFRKDRVEFSEYIDEFYPTLCRWLRSDCREGFDFFRPERLFGKEKMNDTLINECCQKPIP